MTVRRAVFVQRRASAADRTAQGLDNQYRIYADVVELLAERGVRVDPSSIYAWVQAFAPLYEDAARACRRAVGERWSVDETSVKVAGDWAYVYRALDEHGQVVDVYVSTERATEDAAAFFRRAIEATGMVPTEVTADCAAAYPPALAAVLPGVLHETGKMPQQRIERDHQHLKGRTAGCAASRPWPGRGSCAPGMPSYGTCAAASMLSSRERLPRRPGRQHQSATSGTR